jgi:hypothetical protein
VADDRHAAAEARQAAVAALFGSAGRRPRWSAGGFAVFCTGTCHQCRDCRFLQRVCSWIPGACARHRHGVSPSARGASVPQDRRSWRRDLFAKAGFSLLTVSAIMACGSVMAAALMLMLARREAD